MASVAVVGAGVVGLGVADALAARGEEVVVVAAEDGPATVSAVAGGLWLPYRSGPPELVGGWARASYDHLAGLADDPASGVALVDLALVAAAPEVPLWWEVAAPAGAGRAGDDPSSRRTPDRRPTCAAIGADGGGAAADRGPRRVVRVPWVDATIHLPWLATRLRARGVRFEVARLAALDDAFAFAPAVVACPGLAARELFADPEVHAVRGLVVEVACPPSLQASRPALVDEAGPQPTYVLPRGTDGLLLGGRADEEDEEREPRPGEVEDVLARCARLLPDLAAPEVRAVRVGLRPVRPTVRVEAVAHTAGRLVACYGHGGSGWTLAAGCAQTAADLVQAPT